MRVHPDLKPVCSRNAAWGLRDIALLSSMAQRRGLFLEKVVRSSLCFSACYNEERTMHSGGVWLRRWSGSAGNQMGTSSIPGSS